MDRDYEVLCVSQFTLQCILKGNKPDFHSAMPAELAQPFYNHMLETMRTAYKPELIKGWGLEDGTVRCITLLISVGNCTLDCSISKQQNTKIHHTGKI